LNEFYQRVHPLGFWKPFRVKHGSRPLTNIVKPIFRGMGVAVVGFTATSLLIQGLTEAWFGHYWMSLAELVVCAVLFIIFKRTAKAYLVYLTIRTAENTETPKSVLTVIE